MKDFIAQVEEMSPGTVAVVFGGEAVQLPRLTPLHLAEVAAWIRQTRLAGYLDKSRTGRGVPINPSTDNIHATALAKIQCAPVTEEDFIRDYGAHVKIIQFAFARTGRKLSEQEVSEKIDVTQDSYFEKIAELCGFLVGRTPQAEADPTKTAAPNS